MKDSLLRFGVVADKKCTFCTPVVTMMKLSYMFFAFVTILMKYGRS